MAIRGRTMKRTIEEFPEALVEQMDKYGYTNKTLAEAIGVNQTAVSKWKLGKSGMPTKKNLRKLMDVLNLEIVPSTLSDTEAIKVNEVTSEQMRMAFPVIDDDEDDAEHEAHTIRPKWTFIYSTNNSDSYRSAVMHKDSLPDHFRLIMVKQKLQDKKESIPFVVIPIADDDYSD